MNYRVWEIVNLTRVLLGRQHVARFGLMPNASDDFTLTVEAESYTPPPQPGSGNGGSRRGSRD